MLGRPGRISYDSDFTPVAPAHPLPAQTSKPPGPSRMKLNCEITTVPAAVATVSSILVCAIARLVVGVADSTPALEGYAIGVIAIIAYMGIGASLKKYEWEASHLIGERCRPCLPPPYTRNCASPRVRTSTRGSPRQDPRRPGRGSKHPRPPRRGEHPSGKANPHQYRARPVVR